MPLARTLEKLKALVPGEIAAALTNCGGTNRRHARFAANLTRAGLTTEQYLAICHALILPNGVRKTTSPARNTRVLEKLLAAGRLVHKPRIRVLEVGPSAGLDALATWKLLRERSLVERYDLGDLFTELHYDPARGLIFDEDNNLIQVDLGSRFVAIHFAYNYRFQRLTNLPKRLRPWLLRRSLRYDPRTCTTIIPLVHPDLRVGSGETPFHMKRMNVFDPIDGEYDLVVCMHLLVARYFDRTTIERGVRNLSAALAKGGTLVVGSTERFQLVNRAESGALETLQSTDL